MAAFDPVSAAVGGALIGLAVTLLMLLLGRIAGISGIFGDLLTTEIGARGWQLAFVLGLVAAPFLLRLPGQALSPPQMPAAWLVVVVAGFLVGVGTRMAGGCTSGHGVCGLARLSPRSLVATLVFMLTATIVVAIARHGWGG
jgi:hypothetical protein